MNFGNRSIRFISHDLPSQLHQILFEWERFKNASDPPSLLPDSQVVSSAGEAVEGTVISETAVPERDEEIRELQSAFDHSESKSRKK